MIKLLLVLIPILLFSWPQLSNDFYRFLWDGNLFWEGINPYSHTPNQLVDLRGNNFFEGSQKLYQGMSELSKHNYSVYPPFNQLFFIVATAFSKNLTLQLILLKTEIILVFILCLNVVRTLLKYVGKNVRKIYLLFLNPLFLLEGVINVHFEGALTLLLLSGIYFLLVNKKVTGSFFYALAIQLKLTPLMLLPFFIRLFSTKKWIKTYILITFFCLVGFLPLILGGQFSNFFKSIQLYFSVFEFNSSVMFVLYQLDPLDVQFYKISYYSPILSFFSLVIILVLALVKKLDVTTLFQKLTISYLVYLLLSTTVHPWYIIPLLGLSILTNYWFAMLWTFLIMLSYSFYGANDTATSNWNLLPEYFFVLLVAYIDISLPKWKSNIMQKFEILK